METVVCQSASPHLSVHWKMYINFDKPGLHREKGPTLAIGYSPPCCKRPLRPHGDLESHTTSPIQGRVGVLTKFGTTQLAEPPSSSSAHQHPIPQKMGHLTTPASDLVCCCCPGDADVMYWTFKQSLQFYTWARSMIISGKKLTGKRSQTINSICSSSFRGVEPSLCF